MGQHSSPRTPANLLHGSLAGLVLLAGLLGTPSQAGQASNAFNISITYVAAPTSCSATVGTGGPLVACAAAAPVSAGATSFTASSPPATFAAAAPVTAGATGNRLVDTRVRILEAPVAVAEAGSAAWAEYSSRLVASGEVEYLEMTVTW